MKLNYNCQPKQKNLTIGAVLYLLDFSNQPVGAIVIEEGEEKKIFIRTDRAHSIERFKIDFYNQIVVLLSEEGEENEHQCNRFELIDIIPAKGWEVLVTE